MPRRGSLRLGIGGRIDYLNVNEHPIRKHEDAQSETGSVDSEISGNPSWPEQPSVFGKLLNQLGDPPSLWKRIAPDLSYKQVWWANEMFDIGIYGFPRTPLEQQVLRALLGQTPPFSNLEDPRW